MINEFTKNINNEQMKFVESLNSNLVSASAGTGKTWAMVMKLLSLIVDKKVPVKRLLVVTFTKAAANEMKQRLSNALLKYSEFVETNQEKDFLFNQIDDLNSADIGTIDSVGKKWISRYFSSLGIDPTFDILDEKESSYLFNKAVTNVFNKLTINEDKKFANIFNMFNTSRNDAKLKDIIYKIINFISSKINIEEWQNEILCSSCCDEPKYNKCGNFILDYFKNELNLYKNVFDSLKVKADLINEKFSIYLQNIINFIYEFINCENIVDASFVFKNFKLPTKPRESKKWNSNDFELNSQIEKEVEDFKLIKDEMSKYLLVYDSIKKEDYYNNFKLELNSLKEVIANLFNLCDLVLKEFKAIKTNKNKLDFNDIEQYSYKLIKDEKICEDIKNTYDYIFIDEYQDVNELQENIMCGIENNNNLSMIGDVKQSIYAFRRSTPKIFIEKLNKFSNNNFCNIFYFNENYRSDESILEFTNSIMNRLITLKTIGIDYEKTSQLKSGYNSKFKSVVSIELINSLVEDEENNNEIKKDELTKNKNEIKKDELNKLQAIEVVKKITNLIGKPYEIGGKSEVYDYKDIAILLRNKGKFLFELINTLKEFNIPVSASYKIDLFKQIEILFLLSILKIINNPTNDVAMVTVLKSKLCGFDENVLSKISMFEGDNFYCKLLNFKGDILIENKIKSFISYLNNLRFYFKENNLLCLLNKIIYDNDLLNYFLSLPNGMQRSLNIEEFVNIASAEIYSHNLNGFLDYISTIEKNEYLLTVGDGDNSVQIMTMHGSKGLGFPAVILADISTKFRINMDSSDCILNDDFGLGIKYKDLDLRKEKQSIIQKACLIANKKSEINEEVRLFYVALTRAKSNLFLIGTCNIEKISKFNAKNIYYCRSFLDFILFSLNNNDIQYLKNKKESFLLHEGLKSECLVNVINADEISKDLNTNSDIIINELSSDNINKNREVLETNLNKFENSSVVVKNSVSSLLNESKDYEANLLKIEKLSLFDEFSEVDNFNSELGTLYHKIMESMDYNENLDQVIEKSMKLIENSDFDDKVKNAIDFNNIYIAVNKVSKIIENKNDIKKELPFIMKVKHNEIIKDSNIEEKVIVQGVIDLLIINKNNLIVLDFKSNKSKDKNYYANLYKTQLNLYKLAVQKLYPNRPIKTIIYSFALNDFIEI